MHGAATVVVATMALLVAACTSGGHASAVGSASMAPSLKGTLTGTGSTFQFTFQQHAISAFSSVQPGIQVDYLGGGSTVGRADLAAGIVNYAGSDTAPIPAAELPGFKGKTVLYFPVVIGPIAIAYNLPTVGKLQLSGPVIAGIFQGTITKWNDPAIAADNPGIRLPTTPIVIVRRSDSAGTTQNFTKFLTESAPQVWKLGSDSMIHWPARTLPGLGNAGVAAIVKTTPGAIGYVDFADAKASDLAYAWIKNLAGRYVAPSPTSASAAASQIRVMPNLTFSAVWAPGASSYPVTYQSWVLIYEHQRTATDAKMLLAWLGYLLGDGQTLLLSLNYAPLPSNIDQMAARQLTEISP